MYSSAATAAFLILKSVVCIEATAFDVRIGLGLAHDLLAQQHSDYRHVSFVDDLDSVDATEFNPIRGLVVCLHHLVRLDHRLDLGGYII